MSGVRRFADGTVHEEGWNATSSVAVALQGRGTGGSGAPIEVREILFAHYVASGRAHSKAAQLEISGPTYWKRLDSAHYFVAGRLDRDDRRAQQLAGE